MSELDTKDGIVRTLRNTDEPALSASVLADELDVSVRTINNHVDDLEAKERVATTQIGNATAYYIPFEDLPAHGKPDHICARCGRETDERNDFAKVETDTYFVDGPRESELADFYIFCRFCYSDLVSWVSDPAAIGEYHSVHSWEIPWDQLDEVRNDSDTPTKPPWEPTWLDDEGELIYDLITEREEGDWIAEETILDEAEEQGILRQKAKNILLKLNKLGHLDRRVIGVSMKYRSAK